MKKLLVLSLVLIATTSFAFAAKYKVNTSGSIKNSSGQIISPISNTVNQNYNYNQQASNSQPVYYQTYTTTLTNNYYNNFQAGNYVNSNQVNSTPVGIIEFVMDYSGSMSNWIGVAKRSMGTILSQIQPSVKVGFRVFGHDAGGKNPNKDATLREVKKIVKKGNKLKVVTEQGCVGTTKGACSATEQVAPILPININSLLSGMNSVNLGGATPLVYALDRTVNRDFANLDKTSPKKIILITDGGENCGGDPCAFARKLMNSRSDIHIDVVLVSSSSRALACLSSTTGGRFYTVDNLSDFATTINQSMQSLPVNQIEPTEQKYEFIGE